MSEKLIANANVKVVCRFRPLNQREIDLGAAYCHQVYDQQTLTIKDNTMRQAPKFNFDRVFNTQSRQQQVYHYAASPIIDSIIQGFNGTILAYGQTSSGKTHTMEGDISQPLSQSAGIIPRMVQQVFKSLERAQSNIEFRIKVSLVEIYMQKIRDLLDTTKQDLKIRSDKKRGVFIQDLTEQYIYSHTQIFNIVKTARNSRAIAKTDMNQRSSRSHMIFILTISQTNTIDQSAKTGKLYLVDLAGSEKVSKTGAQGKVLDQAKKINLSLGCLGKVINALTDGKSTHIPYRDSKLTRILQQSLGGNSKTSLIVTCSPHPDNIGQTLSTLRFGISAKKIKNSPKINKQMTVAELQAHLQKYESQLKAKQQYIQFLRNHIAVNLKRQIPQYRADSNIAPVLQRQSDCISQLQRQLQLQKTLQSVQQQNISVLKGKNEMLLSQKQDLQTKIQLLQLKVKEYQRQLKQNNDKISQILLNPKQGKQQQNNKSFQFSQLNNFKQKYQLLLTQYQQNKQKNRIIILQHQKYQKMINKKIIQLQNNICQLNQSYYDLIVTQQRYKVDNIFLKRSIQEKDLVLKVQKQKIKDLQDLNRQLQADFNLQERKSLQQKRSQKSALQQSLRNFQQKIQRKGFNHQPNIVKVIKGGMK